jgi:sodium/potassium-transporting ATPase subunit alpha
MYVLAAAQSAFYLGMFIQQCFNLFACKSSMRLPSLRTFVGNMKTWIAIALGLLFGCFIVYTPFVQTAFATANVPPIVMLVPPVFGALMFLYNVVRVYFRLRMKNRNVVRDTVALDLHPTQWTVRK